MNGGSPLRMKRVACRGGSADVVFFVVLRSPHRSQTRELVAPPIVASSTLSRVFATTLL